MRRKRKARLNGMVRLVSISNRNIGQIYCTCFNFTSLLFYFFSSLRRGDQSTVFCMVSFDFNWSRSSKIRHPLTLVCRCGLADIRRFVWQFHPIKPRKEELDHLSPQTTPAFSPLVNVVQVGNSCTQRGKERRKEMNFLIIFNVTPWDNLPKSLIYSYLKLNQAGTIFIGFYRFRVNGFTEEVNALINTGLFCLIMLFWFHFLHR